MIERCRSMLLAVSREHKPPRFLQIYDIDASWLQRHFPWLTPEQNDLQRWLDRHM